jgi:hypothetical protein
VSSAAIRAAARDLENAVGWPAGLPYYDTVSDAPSIASLPDSWFTLVFQGDTADAYNIGGGEFRESGRVVVACLGRSGEGDAALVALVETAAALVREHFAAAGIFIHSISPPQDTDPGIDGPWFRLDTVAEYERFYT